LVAESSIVALRQWGREEAEEQEWEEEEKEEEEEWEEEKVLSLVWLLCLCGKRCLVEPHPLSVSVFLCFS
jgi:hypothetical protein